MREQARVDAGCGAGSRARRWWPSVLARPLRFGGDRRDGQVVHRLDDLAHDRRRDLGAVAALLRRRRRPRTAGCRPGSTTRTTTSGPCPAPRAVPVLPADRGNRRVPGTRRTRCPSGRRPRPRSPPPSARVAQSSNVDRAARLRRVRLRRPSWSSDRSPSRRRAASTACRPFARSIAYAFGELQRRDEVVALADRGVGCCRPDTRSSCPATPATPSCSSRSRTRSSTSGSGMRPGRLVELDAGRLAEPELARDGLDAEARGSWSSVPVLQKSLPPRVEVHVARHRQRLAAGRPAR